MDDSSDVIFLKESDAGDAGGSGFEAGVGVREGDPAESEDWDFRVAGFLKQREAAGRGSRSFLFFEHGGEDGKSCAVGGSGYFPGGVTGDGDERISWWELADKSVRPTRSCLLPYCSYFLRGNVVGAEVDAVGLDCEGYIRARIDEERGFGISGLSDYAHGVAG